ncbi:Fc receptor-like protein 3 [Mustelus asterias]
MKPQHPLLGDNIVLECLKPSGTFGEYSVQWFRNNSPISETSGSRISIEKANHSNEASYRCELRSKYRKWVSEDINIALIDLCSTPILKPHPEVEVFAGQQLNFTCSAEQLQLHYPLLYSFYKNEQLISVPAEQDYYVTEPAVFGDSASYRCEVTTYSSTRKKSSNKLSITVTLIPVSKPDLEIQPRSEIIVGERLSLICSVSTGSTPINYVFYGNLIKVIYWETSNNTKIIYEIVDVGKSAEGNYSCSVSNQASEISLNSESIPLAVIVPVAGALLTSNSNKTEISIGDPLVLHCQLKEGTFPHFRWYLNHQQLKNVSDYYNFSTDGTQLNIHSFQIRDKGRYHCAVINRGPDEESFNTTSNYVDITAPAQSHTAAISASVSTIILISAVIAWLCSKQRKRKQGQSSDKCPFVFYLDSPSSISQQQGDTSRNGPQNTSEVSPEINFEYAVVGRCQNIDSSNGQSNNRTVDNISCAEGDSESDAALVYSVVTITKSKGSGNSGDNSTGKQGDKETETDYCITYATLNHRTNEASLEGDQTEEGGFYENLPRHS